MSLPKFYPPFPEPKTLDEFYMNHVRLWADYVYTNLEKPRVFEGMYPNCGCYACQVDEYYGEIGTYCTSCPILFGTSDEHACCEKDKDSPYYKRRRYWNMPILEEEDVLEMKKLCLDIANLTWTNPASRK